MQTIEEYKEYAKQLEGEVGKWHNAYDASETMNRKLVAENRELKESNTRLAIKNKILQKSHDATNQQLQDLLDEFNKNIDESEINQLKNKSAKADEINAIHQKSLARLEELVNKEYPDEEEDHSEADGILCDMLNALGYKDLTDAWDKIGKWYS